jgi:hypothetical protein
LHEHERQSVVTCQRTTPSCSSHSASTGALRTPAAVGAPQTCPAPVVPYLTTGDWLHILYASILVSTSISAATGLRMYWPDLKSNAQIGIVHVVDLLNWDGGGYLFVYAFTFEGKNGPGRRRSKKGGVISAREIDNQQRRRTRRITFLRKVPSPCKPWGH